MGLPKLLELCLLELRLPMKSPIDAPGRSCGPIATSMFYTAISLKQSVYFLLCGPMIFGYSLIRW